ncbi:MAG: hypothetical protein J7598_24470 [Mitsuaria chitosanitabida]|uniref:hypothetical protein n=1 Tax=Roseateles chitosanitabidus TaxID=65048 RepID=UPI001B21AAA7|nr:hypothetical protein [Roseateles chitosanitabidus]MBO9689768.1 hypothetical protein [Roseateles chitosanitabidus]
MQPTNLQEVIQHIAQQQREKAVSEISEIQQKLITVTFDRAASYTTVIIFGGYAGVFGIWQLSKEYLSKGQTLWTALLILGSLLAFVLFEVIKMILVSRQIFAKGRVLCRPDVQADPQKLTLALRGLDETQATVARRFMVYWAATVVVAVGGALGASAILAYAFISGLAK